jgi:hypothetical protein
LWRGARVLRAGRDRVGQSGSFEPSPPGASSSWRDLVAALPKDQDWDVWTDWYEARLKGRADPEEIDRIYATVPLEKWDEGPAAANAWIKAELARLQERPQGPRPPQEVPRQVPGPHVEIDVETGAVVSAKPESLDAEGNNLARLTALHPQIAKVASELLANVSQNEQPELFAAAKSYFENVNRDLSQIDFERLWGEGIYLEEAAVAATRRIEDKLREPLNDAALTALQALQRIHGPFILATKVGLENLAFANAYDLRVEERNEQFAATKALALKFEANPDVVAPEVAQMVAHYVELPESSTHPERGPAFTGGMMFNISLVLISGAAIRMIKVVAGDEMSAPLSDALKKSKPYANYLSASGLLKDGLDRLSETDAHSLGSKLKKISFEPYREFVIENEALLRRLAGKRREMRWLHEHLDWLKEMEERKLLSPPHE